MNKMLLCIFSLLLPFTVQESLAQRTIRMNLESIIAGAGLIVHGTVTGVTQETDSATHLRVSRITIAVTENFFGAQGSSVTVTMLAGTTQNGRRRLTEMPHFSAGDEIVAMFHTASSIGLTSPVGMGQGTFRIIKGTRGAFVRNTMKNTHLFSGIQRTSLLAKRSWAAAAPEEIALEDFAATIRSFVSVLKK